MSDKLPYIGINQSVICVPPTDTLSMSLDIKILPERTTDSKPYWGVWLLDVSGSMIGSRIDKAKESLIEQVKNLPLETGFNLVIFESSVKTIIKNETITLKSRQKIIDHIKKIRASGGTALFSALQHGIKMVKNYKGNLTKKIILITDGEPGDVVVKLGDKDDPNYKKYFMLAREALEYRASIDTVGALGEHNVYLLYEIAKQSTGKYIFAEDSDELKTKMLIASEQATKIVYSQPSITIIPIMGKIEVDDAVQYKPTVIRMPFEKIHGKLKEYNYKTWMRSFEAGDTYQILIKLRQILNEKNLNLEESNALIKIQFDFGKKGLQTTKEVEVQFSNDSSNHRINPQINKHYANLFSQAEEITEQTIKNDASATQRIQGDETKKISD
ncbi:MAG: vWA domain-containing protein [Promethearchaeota archaeon]